MDDKLLVLQIAFSLIADSPDFDIMTIDGRVEEVRRAYDKLVKMVSGEHSEEKSLVN